MRWRRWLPPALWATFVLAVTSVPGRELAAVGRYDFPGADKAVHATLYAVLGLLAARASADQKIAWRSAAGVLVGVMLFGAVDEWHQRFIPGRAPSVYDWMADSVGAATGVALATAVSRRQERT